MKTFTITVLGTSSGVPTSERYTSAHMLNVCEHFYLFDCGEATQIRLRKERIPLNKINHIFISHLHGDHFFGLFGLISSYQLHERKNDLHIYTFQELEHIINTVIKTKDLPFKIFYHPLPINEKKIILEDKQIIVTAFPLKHRIPTCGFSVEGQKASLNVRKEKIKELNLSISEIIQIKNGKDYVDQSGHIIPNSELTYPPPTPRKYVYCTDTLYDESNIETIKNADLLYHEATFSHEHKNRALLTGHSTAKEAATIAKLSNAKKLLIGHYSVRYKDLNVLLNEAKAVFPETYLAKEGLKIDL